MEGLEGVRWRTRHAPALTTVSTTVLHTTVILHFNTFRKEGPLPSALDGNFKNSTQFPWSKLSYIICIVRKVSVLPLLITNIKLLESIFNILSSLYIVTTVLQFYPTLLHSSRSPPISPWFCGIRCTLPFHQICVNDWVS